MELSLSAQAYQELRRMIVRLELAPGEVLREDDLRARLGIGRTPIREALQRLDREHFVHVVPRRGMFVTAIDVSELSMLFETRTVLEPYAARLAAARGSTVQWNAMAEALAPTGLGSGPGSGPGTSGRSGGLAPTDLLAVDRRCHELMWEAAGNRFLLDTLDSLYAQSDRLWHRYLADVADMDHAVTEHGDILDALRDGNSERAASLVEAHVRSFDEQIRAAVTAELQSPLTTG